MKKLLLLVIFTFSLCATAFSANWIYYGTTAHGVKLYADSDTAFRNNIYASIWTRNINIDGSMQDILIYLFKNDKTFQMQSFIEYDKTGKVIDQFERKTPYTKIPPNSSIEILYKNTWP